MTYNHSLINNFNKDFQKKFIELFYEISQTIDDKTQALQYSYQLANEILFMHFISAHKCFNNENNINYQGNIKPQDLYIALFKDIFKKYKFSIEEKSSNSEELTPEILSILFENNINMLSDTNIRSNAGVFYSPQAEIELMCRLSLVDNLSNHISKDHKDIIYDFIFVKDQKGQLKVNKTIFDKGLWNDIYVNLKHMSIIDPSCGSGAFLVEILFILADLIIRAEKELNIFESGYKVKKEVIANNLYGIDVMKTACTVTKMRLHLGLVAEVRDFSELKYPELNNNIITGNSLNKETLDSISKKLSRIKKSGFDIVIGNPPYVRQEIYNTSDKKEMHKTINKMFSWFFADNELRKKTLPKINAKSDLYLYFFFLGLYLLNDKGTLCYITSNSWLDVDYGYCLQHFLLKHCRLKLLIDNNISRSFGSADINTIISLISSPCEKQEVYFDERTSFITLNIPYYDSISATLFKEIESSQGRKTFNNYKIHSIKQKNLFKEGCTHNKEEDNYTGNKWGSKYLRAPDVYRIILEKNNGKILKLGNIATIKFGIKSGANDFFYLDDSRIGEWHIEEEFLKPFLFSLKEVSGYKINPKKLKRKIFCCDKKKETLIKEGKSNALKYINWGETQNYNHRPSVKTRTLWYSLPKQQKNHFVSNRFIGERFGFPSIEDTLACDVFFVGSFNSYDPLLATALLNSTFSYLSAEVFARKTYGIGVAYLYGPEINTLDILNPDILSNEQKNEIINNYINMKKRQLYKIEKELNQQDRTNLDAIVFDALGLNDIERDQVYNSLLEMVKNRLKKARSV